MDAGLREGQDVMVGPKNEIPQDLKDTSKTLEGGGSGITPEYQMVPLSELTVRITKGTTPTTLGRPFVERGINFVKSEAITNEGRIDPATFAFIDAETHEALSRSKLKEGDVLFSMAGVYLGKTAVVPSSILPANTNQAVGIIRLDHAKAEPRFIHYVLSSPECRSWVQRSGAQSAQPNFNLRNIGDLPIPKTSLPKQRAIAHILGTLDDKIELNRRMNETLETMAQALFKSWFVDFDPVRAKAGGEATESICSRLGLTSEMLALFPDQLQDSELGEIPEGWAISQVGSVVRVVGGSTPSTKGAEYWDEGTIHWVTPKDLSGLEARVLLNTERRISELGLKQISSGLLPTGTLLMSSRAPIGYFAISAIPVAINQGFIAMVCDGPVSASYMLHWCEQNIERIKARAGGTTFPEISKGAFRPLQVLVPSAALMQEFDQAVSPLLEMVTVCAREVNSLKQVRDSLLPKLVSGELHVSKMNS